MLEKLCIPIKYQPGGGMYSFHKNFIDYLRKEKISYTHDITDSFNVLFVNSWSIPHNTIRDLKLSRPDVRVIHRVDGSGWDYGRRDNADERQAKVNIYVDTTIFQSEYSRYSTMEKFPIISKEGSIIYNPVDTAIFNPNGRRYQLEGKIRVATAKNSTNSFKGEEELYQICKENPDIDFYLMGHYAKQLEMTNIHYLGFLDRDNLVSMLRSCHVFLNLSQNDPCPNVVLEALATGLPVLYRNSGGVPELVGECGLPVTINNFREQLMRLFSNLNKESIKARDRALKKYSSNVIFPQYLDVINSIQRSRLPNQKAHLDLFRRMIVLKTRKWFTFGGSINEN